MLITVSDFARERHADRIAVHQWLHRHPDILEATTKIIGKERYIDTDIPEFEQLCKQYPQYVQITQHHPDDTDRIKELEGKLAEAQQAIINLQKELLGQKDTVLKLTESNAALLVDSKALQTTQETLREAQSKADRLQDELTTQAVKTALTEAHADTLRAELDKAQAQATEQQAALSLVTSDRDRLQADVDRLQSAAASYERTWFGLYRKKQ